MAESYENNLFHLLQIVTDSKPEDTFCVFDNEKYSYRTVITRVGKLANFFRKQGINKGDRILLKLANKRMPGS